MQALQSDKMPLHEVKDMMLPHYTLALKFQIKAWIFLALFILFSFNSNWDKKNKIKLVGWIMGVTFWLYLSLDFVKIQIMYGKMVGFFFPPHFLIYFLVLFLPNLRFPLNKI